MKQDLQKKMNNNLFLVLLIPVTTCAIDEATLAQQALNQPKSELFEKLPKELQEYVALWIIKDHPMVDYIKRSADLCTSTLQGHRNSVWSAGFSPDGTTLVTVSRDLTAKIWDVLTGNCLHTLQGHTDEVNSARFSPDGSTLVTASRDLTAKIWDVLTGNCLRTLQGQMAHAILRSFSPDDTTLVTAASDDRAVKIWWNVTFLERFFTPEIPCLKQYF